MRANPARPRWRRALRFVLRQTERGLAIFGLGVIVYLLCFDATRIVSNSMAPTLQGDSLETGDLVLTERVSFWLRKPRRWEVVTIRKDDGGRIMKRVVGLPGERIRVELGGRLFINDRPVQPPQALAWLHYLPFGNLADNKTVSCGEGYFVLGDFTRDSDDSRFNGPVRPDQLVGRAWLILAPAGRRGFVNKF